MKHLVALAMVLLAGMAAAPPTAARSSAVLPYAPTEVWPTTVRFLRIDRGYVIREKDEATGYVLFELSEGQRNYKGSAELVRVVEDGRESTRVVFTLPDLPKHWEQLLIDKLSIKVRDDLGTPPPPSARKPPTASDEKKKPDSPAPPRAPAGELPRAGDGKP